MAASTAAAPVILRHENDSVESNIAKLYLKERWSDVTFIFYADQGDAKVPERICAHKAILAAGSDVFDAMFFGPLKENAEVKIVDAPAAAFKEFLQFFYRRKMQLTLDNVGEVVNLCRKYQVDDALTACEQLIKEKLTIANMCWGYAFSKDFDLPELRRFCEGGIQRNTLEILQSTSFLDSERDEVVDILKILSIDNHSPRIIDAYMNWAKAECVRENLEPNSINLRARLGDDLIKMIPFNRMFMEQFAQLTKVYSGFFTANEFEMIIQGVANCSGKRQEYGAALDCDRRIGASLISFVHAFPFASIFTVNKSVLLTEFYSHIFRTCSCNSDLVIDYRIRKLNKMPIILLEGKTAMACRINEIHVILPQPVLISNGDTYSIVFEMQKCCETDLMRIENPKKVVLMNDENNGGIEIKFEHTSYVIPNDCVTRLKFNNVKD